MDVVFSTKEIVRAKRYNAWRDAICDSYVHVDVDATRPDDYRGFIREEHFGDVVLTDILISEQRIKRNSQHISRLDKDCYYLQFFASRQGQCLAARGNACIECGARCNLLRDRTL